MEIMFNLTGSQKTKISFLIHLLGKRLQYGYYLVWVTVDGSVTISFVAILYYPLQFYKCIIFTRNIFAISSTKNLSLWLFRGPREIPRGILKRSMNSGIQSVLESNSTLWYSISLQIYSGE